MPQFFTDGIFTFKLQKRTHVITKQDPHKLGVHGSLGRRLLRDAVVYYFGGSLIIFPALLVGKIDHSQVTKLNICRKKQNSGLLCATCCRNLQHSNLLRDKLRAKVTVVIRATTLFNLQCNNVVRQVERKCCPYYLTFTESIQNFVFITSHDVSNLTHDLYFL